MSIKDKMYEAAGDDLVKQEVVRKTAQSFTDGWKDAASEVVNSPIAREWVNVLGIHPDRVVHYGDALRAYNSNRGEKPDPEDFKTPVVATLPPSRQP